MAFRMRPDETTSAYEFFTTAHASALTDDVIGQITCPVLVTDPDHEQFWPGQSQELYGKLPARKALIWSTGEEGADSHCEPAAMARPPDRDTLDLICPGRADHPARRGCQLPEWPHPWVIHDHDPHPDPAHRQ
jgi:hypothetical protein